MADKKYKVGSNVYDIPELEINNFLKDFPSAIELETFTVGKDTFNIPINERDAFLSEFPKAQSVKKKEPSKVIGTPSAVSLAEQPPSPLKRKEEKPVDLVEKYLQGIDIAGVKSEQESYIGDLLERIGAGSLRLATSGPKQTRFAQKLLNIPRNILKKELSILGVSEETADKIANSIPFLKGKEIEMGINLSEKIWEGIEKTEGFKNIEKEAAELSESSQRYDKTIGQLIKNKEYNKAIGASFLSAAESLPLTLTAMFGGPVGLAEMGLYSASEQYDQLNKYSDINEVNKIANSLINGGLEIVTERLGSANYGKLIKNVYKTAGKKPAEEAIKKGLKSWFTTMFKRFGIYTQPIGEAMEEGINQIGGNITARVTGEDPERPILFNVADAIGGGFAGGTMFIPVGAIGQARQQMLSQGTKKKIEAPETSKYKIGEKPITKEEAARVIDEAKEFKDIQDLEIGDDKALESRIRDKFNLPTEEAEEEIIETKVKEEPSYAESIREKIEEPSRSQELVEGEEERLRVRNIEEDRLEAEKREEVTPEEPVQEEIDVYDYQDTHAERLISSGKWHGGVWRYKLENAGDILRELAKYKNEFIDLGYIFEKVNKIKDFLESPAGMDDVHPDDQYATLKVRDKDILDELKQAYIDQPTMSEAQDHAKKLILNLIEGRTKDAMDEINYFEQFRSDIGDEELKKANTYRTVQKPEVITERERVEEIEQLGTPLGEITPRQPEVAPTEERIVPEPTQPSTEVISPPLEPTLPEGVVPPAPPMGGKPIEEPTTYEKTRKREIGRKIVEESTLPQEIKDALLEEGIEYIPRGKKVTQKEAKEIVKIFSSTEGGLDKLAQTVYDIKNDIAGDTRTALNVYLAEQYSRQLADAVTMKDRETVRRKLADAFIFAQEQGTRAGQFAQSQILWREILARDPEAIIVIRKRAQSKNNADTLQAMNADIKTAKEMLDSVIQTSEFKKILEERISEEIDKIGTKKYGAVDKKKIDDFFKSLEIKNDKLFDATIGIPIAVYNGALQVVKRAVLAGVDIINAINQAVEYIDNWYKENYTKKEISSPDWNKDDYIATMQDRLKPLSKKVSKVKYKIPKKVEDKLVDDIYAKMESATKPQLRRLVKEYVATLDEEGVVTEERFKDLFAKALGLDVLTPEGEQIIRLAGQSINHARKKADDLLDAYNKYIEEEEKTDADPVKLKELESKIREKKKIAQQARIRAQKSAQKLDKILQEDITLGQTIATLIQGNLLTLISLITNVAGNVAFIPVRAVKSMVASSLDVMVTGLSMAYTPFVSRIDVKKHPRLAKHLAGLPTPKRVYSNFAGIKGYAVGFSKGTIEGLRQVLSGQVSEDLYHRDLMRSLEPLKAAMRLKDQLTGEEQFRFDKALADFLEALPGGYFGEFFFRALNLGDKPFRRAAEQARLEEIATLKNLRGMARRRFLNNPDEESVEEMRKAGDVAVYQQDSVISKGISQIKKKLNSTSKINEFKRASIISKTLAHLLISTLAPYVKTPLNLIAEAFDYSVPIYSAARGIEETIRGNRRKALDFFGKAIVGHILVSTAIWLIKNGILTPPPDEDEKIRQAQYTGKPGYNLNIDALWRTMWGDTLEWQEGDRLWNIQRFGVPSMILMGVGKAYSKIPPEKMEDLSYITRNIVMLPYIASGALDQSFLSGMATGLSAFTEGGPAYDNWILNTSKALSATVYPNTAAQISQTFFDENYIREVRDIYDRDKKFEQQIKNTFKDRMFMGKDLPAKVSIWGERVARVPEGRSWPYMLFDVTKQIKYQKSSFGVRMFEFYEKYKFIDETAAKGILPSLPSATNQVGWDNRNMTASEVELLQINVGKARRMYVEYLMSSSQWEAMDDVERIAELESIYRTTASKVKSQMFLLDILKTNKDIWQYMINNDLIPVPTKRIQIEINKKKVILDEEQTKDYYDIVQRKYLEKLELMELDPNAIIPEEDIEKKQKNFNDKWNAAKQSAKIEMKNIMLGIEY